MGKMNKRIIVPVSVILFVGFVLVFIQLKVERPMLILERFINGGGWFEIPLIALYGGFLSMKMLDPSQSAKWRLRSWTLFSVVFFGQLILGLAGFERFLMTGKLHLPIPMMIMGGPLYRGELSFMTILFLSTIVLTGPAWCSHLCYFGAMDNLFSNSAKPKNGRLKYRSIIKASMLLVLILVILILRWLNVSILLSTILGIAFGVGGVIIMLRYSSKKGKMIHCLTWCPVGTIVNFGKFLNPFRMYIDQSTCTLCNACTRHCRYDALNREDIESGKPGITCTLCGDCIGSCHVSSIRYSFFKLSPEKSRNLYLILTVSTHVMFLALARI